MTSTRPPQCQPAAVFSQMRAAMGADRLAGVHEIRGYGTIRTSGLNGNVTVAVEISPGIRFSEREDLAGIGPSATVYDGKTVWSQDISGGVHPYNAPFPQQEAITHAYVSGFGFLNDTSNATCLGNRVEYGHSVVAVRVQPSGGIPATLLFGERDHLLYAYTERFPIDVQSTTFSDYRIVNGVMLPFRITTGSVFEPANADVVSLSRYALLPVADATDFQKPKTQNAAVMDAGAPSTTIPLRVEKGVTIVWASINNHAPMPFLLDSGGHAIFTKAAAQELKLKQIGAGQSGGSGSGTVALRYAHVASVRIGAATLPQQNFLVIDYPPSFSYRGRGKQPLAGILGLEIFEHFRVALNYAKNTMTLTPAGAPGAVPRGTGVALSFDEDMPLADAAFDGHVGLFGIDTGNSGAVIAYHTYLQSTGLDTAYPGGKQVTGHGTGGTNSARIVRVKAVRFGGKTFKNVPIAFTNMKSGSFSSWAEAGDIGYALIASFNATFDFATDTLYLESRHLKNEFRTVAPHD